MELSRYYLGRTFEGNLIYASCVKTLDDGCVVVKFNPDSTFMCKYIKVLLDKVSIRRCDEGYVIFEKVISYWSDEIIKGQRRWAVGLKAHLCDKVEDACIYAEVLSLNVKADLALVWIPGAHELQTDKFMSLSAYLYDDGSCPINARLYEIPIAELQGISASITGESCETFHESPEEVAKKLCGSWADYADKLSEILCKDIDLYQQKCLKYAKYPESARIIYPTLGLTGEAGEVSDKVKKVIRDSGGEFTDEIKKEIMKELGDVLWYCATLAHDLDFSLSDVAFGNIEKLESRFQRNKIGGSGDNR